MEGLLSSGLSTPGTASPATRGDPRGAVGTIGRSRDTVGIREPTMSAGPFRRPDFRAARRGQTPNTRQHEAPGHAIGVPHAPRYSVGNSPPSPGGRWAEPVAATRQSALPPVARGPGGGCRCRSGHAIRPSGDDDAAAFATANIETTVWTARELEAADYMDLWRPNGRRLGRSPTPAAGVACDVIGRTSNRVYSDSKYLQ
jgi:hypothetical protein